ncbi:MAG: hypothetical protein ACLFRY_02415 [Spirochaetia bacterium]
MNRNRIIYILLPLVILAGAAAASVSCTQGDLGIFYSLEIESELERDRGLADSLKVWNMTKTDNDNYYIAAGKVYTRSAGGDEDWSAVDPPETNMLSSNIVFFDGYIFSVFRTEAGVSRLYRRPDTSGTDWTEIADTEINGKDIMTVFSAHDTLFVCRREDGGTADGYTLWHSQAGDPLNFDQTALGLPDDESPRFIFDAAFDGTDYWVISGGILFTGTSDVLTEATMTDSAVGTISPHNFGGIFFADSTVYTELPADLLFLTDSSGNLYTLEEGNTFWHVGVSPSTENQNITFYDMELLTVNPSGTDIPILIIGSNNGYYEVPFDGTEDLTALAPARPDIDSYSTSINYLNTTLSTGTILELFLDNRGTAAAADDLMYACTSSTGLWVNNLGDQDRVWSQE